MTRTERIALITDCLRNPETELLDDPGAWKHELGHPVTEDELAEIRKATLGDIRFALGTVGVEWGVR